MTSTEAALGIETRISAADRRYGPYASTHEALGVIVEEFDELRAAIHANALGAIQYEALDLAAALIRLHDCLLFPASNPNNAKTIARSIK